MVSSTHVPPSSVAAAAHIPLADNPCAQYLIHSKEVIIAPGLNYKTTRGELYRRVKAWSGEPISGPAFKRYFNACAVFFGLLYVPDTHACIGGLGFRRSRTPVQSVGQRHLQLAQRRWQMVFEIAPIIGPTELTFAAPPKPDSQPAVWAAWAAGWFVRIHECPEAFTPLRETEREIIMAAILLFDDDVADLTAMAKHGSDFCDWARYLGLSAGGWIRCTLLSERFAQFDTGLYLKQFSKAQLDDMWNNYVANFTIDLNPRKPETVLRYMLDGSTHRDLPVPV